MSAAQTNTQVTAVGVLPANQLEALTSVLLSQSQTQRGAELLRQTEHVLVRSDEAERIAIERSDSMWAPVVRARASNMRVRMEGGRCQLVLPLLHLPTTRRRQAVTVRPIVFNELFLSPASSSEDESFGEEWREIVDGLGWKPNFTLHREGLRFQLIGGSSATAADKVPDYLTLEVLVCSMDCLRNPTPSSPTPSAYLVHVIASVPPEEVWKRTPRNQTSGGDVETAAEVAVKEVENLCEALKSVVELTKDSET